MDKLFALACFLMAIVVIVTTFPDGNAAVFLVGSLSFLVVFAIRKLAPIDKQILSRIFILALLLRVVFGLVIHTFELREFFGGDAVTYDKYGNLLMESWFGNSNETADIQIERRMGGVGWGMVYFVAWIYAITGRNILAAQYVSAVVGAAIAPLLFFCSFRIFNNRRVSQVAAVLAAVFPAFIIWTGQLLKDGLIVFLIVLTMTMVIELQKKISVVPVLVVMASLFGIISLRFYIFYMIVAAVAGTFIVGFSDSKNSIFRRLLVIAVMGLGLTYLGVLRNASSNLDRFGSLEKIQTARYGSAARTGSGFGEDIDVSTTEGAISAIPLGLVYLYLAPFPWQLANLRQAITLPDTVVWYGSLPFLIAGLFYSIKNRLRPALGILIFSGMLSLSYSLFQGNVGTAYRQRCQIQVFLFIFVGVGWTMFQERRENKKAQLLMERRKVNERLQANRIFGTS